MRHSSEDGKQAVEYTNLSIAYGSFLLRILRTNELLYCFSNF